MDKKRRSNWITVLAMALVFAAAFSLKYYMGHQKSLEFFPHTGAWTGEVPVVKVLEGPIWDESGKVKLYNVLYSPEEEWMAFTFSAVHLPDLYLEFELPDGRSTWSSLTSTIYGITKITIGFPAGSDFDQVTEVWLGQHRFDPQLRELVYRFDLSAEP